MQVKQTTMNNILQQGAELDEENRALKFMLTSLQFANGTAKGCCPVCGGNEKSSGHAGECEIAALIDPDHATRYKEMTGLSIIDALLFSIENQKKVNFSVTQGFA